VSRLATALLLCLCSAYALGDGQAKLVYYESPVDRSQQAYGVYVPDGLPPASGYPVALHAHGYGWSVGSGFSQWQKDWADAHRWLLVNLNARGPNFYWGIGDIATAEVIDDLHTQFGIDRRRVYITGGSMGGTGAFRQGTVHPDYIAAAVGVDGWTDFREWHYHWYARKDQHNDIEEFRRPLLEAASPIHLAERARWGDVHVIADGKDSVVLPWQGQDFAKRLAELGETDPGTYDSGLTYNPDKSHGGGYSVSWIYDYFLGRSLRPEQGSFVISTPVLDHGEMYWGRMERLQYQGQKALLECAATTEPSDTVDYALGLQTAPSDRPWEFGMPVLSALARAGASLSKAPPVGVINVSTTNLDAFTLHTALSPVAEMRRVVVFIDGICGYDGPPHELTFEAVRDEADRLADWHGWPCAQPEGYRGATLPLATVDETMPKSCFTSSRFRKSREISGPVGHAFVTPFVVCYGGVGPDDLVRRHRDEATAFCKGWNSFMVHGTGLEAIPEDALDPADLAHKNLVMYGTFDTSRLLSRAQAAGPLPVEVYADRIIVRDPLTGDREYRGRKFGTFSIYPNPLTNGRTYLVICKGRYATKSDGTSVQGLEFDLEKLYWGYSDYVIFNTDRGDLPHVMNVNNKPPVTCYEPGYFVEAGYYDFDWQLDRFATIERVKRTKPDKVRQIHVAEVKVEKTTSALPVFAKIDGDPPDPERKKLGAAITCAAVKVVDSAGKPVRQARVTGRWVGLEADSISRLTLSTGVAYFPYPGSTEGKPAPRFRVLNVMATGAAYDFQADALPGSAWESADGRIALRAKALRRRIDPEELTLIDVDVQNLSDETLTVNVDFLPPNGEIKGPPVRPTLEPGRREAHTFRWQPDPGRLAGMYAGTVQASAGVSTASCRVRFTTTGPRPAPVWFVATEPKDITAGAGYEIKTTLYNGDPERTLSLKIGCTLLEPSIHLAARDITIEPGKTAAVVWGQAPDEEPLAVGEYTARVKLLGMTGMTDVKSFTVH